MIKYTVDLYERKGFHLFEHVVQLHIVSEEVDSLGFDSVHAYIMDKSKLYIKHSLDVCYTLQQELIDYNV